MIPGWNISDVLPPIRPGERGSSPDRSPYRVSLSQVVERFATSPKRINILEGLLEYRRALHSLNILTGFQWLDGSFMENVETLESRPPNDVDAVLFCYLPDGTDQQKLVTDHPELFYPAQAKSRFNVDAYICILGEPTSDYHVERIAYWYSMWSHRRGGLWKGFIQVALSASEDDEAAILLKLKKEEGGML